VCYPKPGPRCDGHVLESLFDKIGIQRPTMNAETIALAKQLISSRGGLKALVTLINSTDSESFKHRLLRVYKAGFVDYSYRMEQIGKTPRPIEGAPENLPKIMMERNVMTIASVAHHLYAQPLAPLNAKARRIESKFTSVVEPATPGVAMTKHISHEGLAKRLKVNLQDIPDNVVAFDIETDTSRGLGLQPHRTQITEMVLSTREKSIVFSGDERHILQGFSDYMNSMPEGTKFVGWNSSGFDVPALAIRSSVHDNIEGWGLETRSAPRQSRAYIPVGGYESAQQMVWTTPSGVVHTDVDGMAEANALPEKPRSIALKKFVRSFGADPIELDREKMHTYSEQEREAYVASDGICTLFAEAKVAGLMKSAH
jgi:hypothetical protein